MSTTLLPGANNANVNKGPAILATTLVVTIAALVAVCSRMYVRIFMIHSTGPDDYVILFAMMQSIVGLGLVIPEVQNGAGRHIAYVDPDKAKVGLELNFITQPIYLWAITTVKVSIGLFFLRIAPTKFFRRFLQGTLVCLVAYTFVSFMTIVLQCKNLAVNWDSTISTTCWAPTTLRTLSYTSQSINIFTDLMLAAIPVPMLWHVQINMRVKASLMCIMGLGIFASVASIMKLSTLPRYGLTGDFLWDSAEITIWTVVECNVGIITACLPCLKPLFKRILEKSWAYGSSKTRHNTNDLGLSNMPPGLKYHNSATASRVLRSQNHFETLRSKRDDLEDNKSEESIESILPMQGNTITKSTVVTVTREIGVGKEYYDNARPKDAWERAGKVEFAIERRVEDRV